MSVDGEHIADLHPVDSLQFAVPYWPSFTRAVGAAGRTRIVTANNFFYPLRLYDSSGSFLREFGSAPPSWRAPTRPERGAFTGAGGFDRMSEWLRDQTVINSLGIHQDRAILVVHAVPDPRVNDFWARRDTLLDVYTLNGQKLWEDVTVPGRILRVADEVLVLEGEPPAGWIVGRYRIRPDALD